MNQAEPVTFSGVDVKWNPYLDDSDDRGPSWFIGSDSRGYIQIYADDEASAVKAYNDWKGSR